MGLREAGRPAGVALALAACWTGEPPAPKQQASVMLPAKWGTHVLHYVPPDAPVPTPQQRADAFAQQLRATADSELPRYVNGPVVVLDAGAGTISILCGQAALQAARELGAKLVDPTRPKVTCGVSTGSLRCVQWERSYDLVFVELEDIDAPHLTHGAFGVQVRSQSAPLLRQLTAQVATATCP